MLRAVLVPRYAKNFTPKNPVKDAIIVESGYSRSASGVSGDVIQIPDVFVEDLSLAPVITGKQSIEDLSRAADMRAARIKAAKSKRRNPQGKRSIASQLPAAKREVHGDLLGKIAKSPAHKSVLNLMCDVIDDPQDIQILGYYFLVKIENKLFPQQLAEKFKVEDVNAVVQKIISLYEEIEVVAKERDLKSFEKVTWYEPEYVVETTQRKLDSSEDLDSDQSSDSLISGDMISFYVDLPESDLSNTGVNISVSFDGASNNLMIVSAKTAKPTYLPSKDLGDDETAVTLNGASSLREDEDLSFQTSATNGNLRLTVGAKKDALAANNQFLRLFFSRHTGELLIFHQNADQLYGTLKNANKTTIQLAS